MKERRTLLIALLLMTLALGFVYWLYRNEKARQQALRSETRRVDVESSALKERGAPEVEVTLYFYRRGALLTEKDLLVARKRSIRFSPDATLMARQIVNELIQGPRGEGALAIFPARSRLRQVYLLEDGTAVVDLSQQTARLLSGGVVREWACIRAVSRSLVENLAQVERVRFLVGGRERPSLAGHVSIRGPFM